MKPNNKSPHLFYVDLVSFYDMGVNFHPGWNNRYSLRSKAILLDWFQRHFLSAGKFQLHPLKSRSYGKRWRIGDTFQPPLLQRTMVSKLSIKVTAQEALSKSQLSWKETICALDFANFSLGGSIENLYNIYRSVEKENSPPDEEMVEGWGRKCYAMQQQQEFGLNSDSEKSD